MLDPRRIGSGCDGRSGSHRGRWPDGLDGDGAAGSAHDFDPRAQGALVTGSVRVVSDGPIGGLLRFEHPGVGAGVVGASPPLERRPLPGAPPGGRNQHLGGHSQPERNRAGVDLPLDERGGPCWKRWRSFWRVDRRPGISRKGSRVPICPILKAQCASPQSARGNSPPMAVELDAGNRIFTTLPVVPVPERVSQE